MLFTYYIESVYLQLIFLHVIIVQCASVNAAQPEYVSLPPLREQAAIKDGWTTQRTKKIPNILLKYGVDAWLMTQREHSEDTIFWSVKSFEQFAARRRTLQLFLANPLPGTPASYTWIDNTPILFESLLEILTTQNVSKIAINTDQDIAFSSGLHVGELTELTTQLGPEWISRFVSIPMIGVEYVATMVPDQLDWYRKLQSTAWSCISEAFSESVITPGVTTTTDVEWWLREKVQSLHYGTWFHPDVEIVISSSVPGVPGGGIVNHGDLLHVDFGVTALGMNTDTQHLAYVLYPGETEKDIPKGLKEGMKKANRLQDILRENMVVGMTGNEILKTALKQMHGEGIEGSIYSHPIGDWGHSAGTLIGMTNLQSGVPVLGKLPLLNKTYYSVELYAEHFVKERNETLNFYLEEDVFWDSEGNGGKGSWEWVWGRQEEFWVIKSEKENMATRGREDL